MTGADRRADGWLHEVLTASPDGMAVLRAAIDASGRATRLTLRYVNPAAAAWWGLPIDEAIDRELRELLDPRRGAVLWDLCARVIRTGQRQRVRVHQPSDRGEVVVDLVMERMQDRFVIVTFRDVSHAAADEQLMAAAYEQTTQAQATLQAALDATTDAFAVYDTCRHPDGHLLSLRLVQMNAAGVHGLGVQDREDLLGKDIRDFYPAALHTGLWDVVRTAVASQATQNFRLHETDACGAWIGAWDNTIAPAGKDRVVITWRDVSNEARRERELASATDAARFAANHDPLTGLANRALLAERMSEALTAGASQEEVAIVYVDLDQFKLVNDSYGHAAGDDLLRVVTTRLRELVRARDTVARVGGDEFVLLLRELPPTWNADHFVARARTHIEQSTMLCDHAVHPRASFGVVLAPPGTRDVEQVLCRADYAMYQDKDARRSTSCR